MDILIISYMLCIGYNELIVAGYDHHHLPPKERHFAPFFYGRVIGGMPACKEVSMHACSWSHGVTYITYFCFVSLSMCTLCVPFSNYVN